MTPMADSEELTLNVAAQLPKSCANGPGLRYVVWLQGCPLSCDGCFNTAFQPFITRHLIDPDAMATMITSVPDIEGVTYTGGEPMMQAHALFSLSLKLKEKGLTIVCYSGFTHGELRESDDPWIARLLDTVDVLVDGRYDRDMKRNLMWRGSSNQRVHFLTSTYAGYEPMLNEDLTEMELVVGNQGFAATGFLQLEVLAELRALLSQQRASEGEGSSP